MKTKLIILFALAMFFRLFLAPLVWHPDVTNHVDWGIRFYEYGPQKFYAPESNVWSFTWPNQPPGTILIFAFIRKFYEFTFNFFWQINVNVPVFPSALISFFEARLYQTFLKLPALLSDIGIAFLIYKILTRFRKESVGYFGALLFLANPVIWYNSAVWGQTDSVINFFFLLALWFLFSKKPALSLLSLAVSLYIKISLAIFLPIYVLVFLKQKFSINQIAISLIVPIVVFGLLTLPFSYPSEPFGWLFNIYREKVFENQLQVITANAFNVWAFLTGIAEKPHSQLFGLLSYQAWGVILFLAAYIPLLYWLFRKPGFGMIMWALALSAFSSFMLLTNMHERYLYPLFPYFTIIVSLESRIFPLYLLVSGVNLVNIYNLWWVPSVDAFKYILTAFNGFATRALSFFNIIFYGLFYAQFVRWSKLKNTNE